MTETKTFKKILFCTDFSKNAHYAFNFAVDEARRCPGSVLYILHVVPEPDAKFWNTYLYEVDDVDDKAQRDMSHEMNQHYMSRVPSGVTAKVEIRGGRDDMTILEFAKEKDVDLIVLGRHGKTGWAKLLFGNVTESIARKAECAVLMVPFQGDCSSDAAN